MKKTLSVLFAALCLAVLMVPSVGLLANPESRTIGNEDQARPPALQDADGAFNTQFLSELGAYFEKSFAFRSQAITADAEIQANVFGVSNIDSVAVGSEGWLYYTSTIDDYLGRNTLTELQVSGVVRNLELIGRHVKSTGAEFLFTIAPNKNTLYPAHMPYYYSQQVSSEHNRDLVNDALAHSDVRYCNLFELFEQKDETLYLERDSHWNGKGALMVYNEVLSSLGKQHDDYASATVARRKDFVGDLDSMLFPDAPDPEYNYYYGAEDAYTYTTPTKSVEDPTIKTENPKATGSLYMYRDSFGNSLLPFFASAYGKAMFTKSFPMMLELDLKSNEPDDVVFELVERNINWLIATPPIAESPHVSGVTAAKAIPSDIGFRAQECPYSPMYLQVTGTMDYEALAQSAGFDERPEVYLTVSNAQGMRVTYECYDYLDEQGADGFLAYLSAADYEGAPGLTVSAIIETPEGYMEIGSATVEIEGGNEG